MAENLVIDNVSHLYYSVCVEDEELNYNLILEKCGVGIDTIPSVVNKIYALEEFYSSEDLVKIYSYFLIQLKEPKLLIEIVRLSDAHKSLEILNILLNLLTFEANKLINEVNSDDVINLKIICAKAISNYKDTSTVTTLLSCMDNKNEDYKVRLACADALGKIGDKYAVSSLLQVVQDSEEKSIYLKESATSALGMLGDASVIEPLVSILESKQGILDKFSFLKEKIIEALGKLNINNARVMKALKTSLMDSSPMVRINAIEAIMNSNDEASAEMIKPCLRDEDAEVQKNALVALYNLLGRDILDEVLELPIYSEVVKNEAREIMSEYEQE